MKFKQWALIICLAALIGFEWPLEAKLTLFWPTPGFTFTKGSNPADFVQPTESGKIKSALFGCVRNDGERFHEGLDLAPVRRDRKGEHQARGDRKGESP